MKNLLVLSNTSKIEAKKYIDYINLSGIELDIIEVSEDSNSYKNLDRAIYLKQKKQLLQIQNYKYCFFLNDNIENINLPEVFKEVQNCNINVFNPFIIKKFGEKLKVPSPKFWYSTSFDFDTIGKFWKSDIIKVDNYFNSGGGTINDNKRLDCRPDAVYFLYWLNQINVNTNFI